MGKKEMAVIKTLEINVEKSAGRAARTKVMEGSERLSAKSGPVEIAAWLKGAMDRLDQRVAKEKRTLIRTACGRACAEKNKGTLARTVAKRKKFKTMDAFLAAEQKKPLTGTRLVRDGDILYWSFTPRSFNPPMRCFCALMKGLPADETISPTYCLCSRGFVERYWEAVLERPVKVELQESCLRGAPECRFAIRF
jgi:hypothetical protein